MIGGAIVMLVTAAAFQVSERSVEPGPGLGRQAGNPSQVTAYAKAETRRAHVLFGECVVKRYPKRAAEYLLQPYVNLADRNRQLDRMDLGDCLTNVVDGFSDIAMTLPGDTLRYAQAPPLVRASFGFAPVRDFKGVPPLRHAVYNEADFNLDNPASAKARKEFEEAKALQRGATFLSRFGECVVRTDPANSFALTMAVPESVEDKARMAALVPVLASCLGPGQQLAFERSLLRGTIANNYFRLATAARTVRATPGATR